jgi:hypothetical protein
MIAGFAHGVRFEWKGDRLIGAGLNMRYNRCPAIPAWWKQDFLAVFAVIAYLALGAVVVMVWNGVSHQADSFSRPATSAAR